MQAMTVDSNAQSEAPSAPMRGHIEKLKLTSAIMGMERRLQIYLPPSYHKMPTRRYPVLYMHFGQRIFEPQRPGDDAWQVHRLMEKLLDANQIEEVIVVGIAAERTTLVSEYSHSAIETEAEARILQGFEAFILQELKPFIDSTYRTLSGAEHTAMIGASASTTITYMIAQRNPSIFGKIGLLSPMSYSLDTRTWLYPMPFPKYQGMLWIGIGEMEGQHTFDTRAFVDVLLASGFAPGVDFFYTLTPNAGHHDLAWGEQMLYPLLLFFGRNRQSVNDADSWLQTRIGSPIAVELLGDDQIGVDGQPLVVNLLVQYDSGFKMTVLDGTYHVTPTNVVNAQMDGRLYGLQMGSAEVWVEIDGLTATRQYHVVPNLPDQVELQLCVHVPDTTPDVAKIYFNILALDKTDTQCFSGRYILPRGFTLADRFSWDMRKFELDRDGAPIPRRILCANTDCAIEYTIERWSL